jgi:hypothetical protein
MAISETPPISMSDIVAEFGGPGDLLSYVRGGAYVPDISANSSIPTSAPISILDFLGATAGEVSLSGAASQRVTTAPTVAVAVLEFRNDGTVWATETGGSLTQRAASTDWVRPGDVADDYQMRFTVLSGDTPSGVTFGSWLSMATTRSMSLSVESGNPDKQADIRAEVRRGTGSTLESSDDYSIYASVFAG